MVSFKNILPLLLIASLVLPSCKRDEALCCSHEKAHAVVNVYPMTEAETKSLFEGRGRHLITGKDAIIPLRVVVENPTHASVTVKPATMAIVDSEVIYTKVKKNVAAIATAGAVGGLLLTPLASIAIGAGCGIGSAKKNDRILSEISHDAFLEAKEVQPQSVLNKIMFVKESDFKPQFSLSVGSHVHMVDLAESNPTIA